MRPENPAVGVLAGLYAGALALAIMLLPSTGGSTAQETAPQSVNQTLAAGPIVVPYTQGRNPTDKQSHHHLLVEASVKLVGSKVWPLPVPLETAMHDLLMSVVSNATDQIRNPIEKDALSLTINEHARKQDWWPDGAEIIINQVELVLPR